MLDRAHEGSGIVQALVRARVEPCKTPPKAAYVQVTALQIGAVYVSDFQLAAR